MAKKSTEMARRASMISIIRHWALLPYCLTGATAAMGGDTPKLGTGADTPKPAHHEMSLEEMSKKIDNPLSDLWLLWMQNDHMQFNGNISSKNQTVNVSYFEPVLSVPLSNKWNLVIRPVITRINAQFPDLDLGPLEDKLGGLPRGQGLGHPGSAIRTAHVHGTLERPGRHSHAGAWERVNMVKVWQGTEKLP